MGEKLQQEYEVEARNAAETMRQKKKMEGDFQDIEMQLQSAIRQSADHSKQCKILQNTLKEYQVKIEKADKQRDDALDAQAVTDRRSNMLTTEIDELKKRLEEAEKIQK